MGHPVQAGRLAQVDLLEHQVTQEVRALVDQVVVQDLLDLQVQAE